MCISSSNLLLQTVVVCTSMEYQQMFRSNTKYLVHCWLAVVRGWLSGFVLLVAALIPGWQLCFPRFSRAVLFPSLFPIVFPLSLFLFIHYRFPFFFPLFYSLFRCEQPVSMFVCPRVRCGSLHGRITLPAVFALRVSVS